MRFDAFGQRSALSVTAYPTAFQYAGRWGYQSEFSDTSDQTLGLDYLEQRYYEPATGRFISPDPIGLAGGLNLFAYCGNDPVNCVDPFGLWRTGSYWGDVGAVFQGYGDLANPFNWYAGLKGLYDVGRDCGVGAAGRSLLGGIWQGYTGWLTTDDPRAFGRSFGTVLATAASAGAPFARAPLAAGSAATPSIQAIGATGEDAVSQAIGVTRNIGPGRVTVPGTGAGGFRIPDFDPAVTIARRGTVVEVKNVAGNLYITRQLRDLIAYARSQGVPLEIFTNASVRGRLAGLAARGIVRVRPIP
jgi:RHS repeat-associated protein